MFVLKPLLWFYLVGFIIHVLICGVVAVRMIRQKGHKGIGTTILAALLASLWWPGTLTGVIKGLRDHEHLDG